jgi:hypothetical protein
MDFREVVEDVGFDRVFVDQSPFHGFLIDDVRVLAL